MLEASAADIEFDDGRFVIAGTDRAIGIMELAEKLHAGRKPAGRRAAALDVDHVSDGVPATYPNGCHVAEVEIDPDTGIADVVSYMAVNDFGTVINPLIVEGQIHGGVVQGIGQALHGTDRLRRRRPAPDRLLHGLRDAARRRRAAHSTWSLTRCRPRPIRSASRDAAKPAAPARLASVMNAVVDALSEYGIRHIDMPATPQPHLGGDPGREGKQGGVDVNTHLWRPHPQAGRG